MRVLNETDYAYLQQKKSANDKSALYVTLPGVLALLLGFLVPGSFIVGICLLLLGFGLMFKSRPYMAGIAGEEAVVNALKGLDDSYAVVNDVLLDSRGGNIDHVLLCSKGIFAIETKNYTGEVWCSGDYWSQRTVKRIYHRPSISKAMHFVSGASCAGKRD